MSSASRCALDAVKILKAAMQDPFFPLRRDESFIIMPGEMDYEFC